MSTLEIVYALGVIWSLGFWIELIWPDEPTIFNLLLRLVGAIALSLLWPLITLFTLGLTSAWTVKRGLDEPLN